MNPDKSRSVRIDDYGQLFENLLPIEKMIPLLSLWLKRNKDYKRDTIYRWCMKDGMPHKKIRGALYFPPDEVALWLKRTS